MLCDRCYQWAEDGEHGVGLCPLEARREAAVVRPDDIPGGLVVEHGLCHPDGTPRTYYSRSEMRREAAERGLVAWTDIHTEDKTKDARVRMDWYASGEAQRQKRDRDEQRREGVYRQGSDWKRTAPARTSDATKAQIRQAVIERLRAYR